MAVTTLCQHALKKDFKNSGATLSMKDPWETEVKYRLSKLIRINGFNEKKRWSRLVKLWVWLAVRVKYIYRPMVSKGARISQSPTQLHICTYSPRNCEEQINLVATEFTIYGCECQHDARRSWGRQITYRFDSAVTEQTQVKKRPADSPIPVSTDWLPEIHVLWDDPTDGSL